MFIYLSILDCHKSLSFTQLMYILLTILLLICALILDFQTV